MAKYCSNCGNEVKPTQAVCVNCGHQLNQKPTRYQAEESTLIYAVIGFFVPLVGLILFLVWNEERPEAARSAGKGALLSVILGTIIGFLMMIFGFMFMFA